MVSVGADVWGISDRDFGNLQMAMAAGGVVLAVVLMMVMRPPGRFPLTGPHPYVAAFVAGGPARVLLAAVTKLKTDGVLAMAPARRLRVVAPLPPGSHPVDAMIPRVLRDRKRTINVLLRDPQMRAALSLVGEEARRAGLLMSPHRRRLIVFVVFGILLLVLSVGVARFVANPVFETDLLGGTFFSTFFASIPLPFLRTHWRTRAGARLLEQLRKVNAHLDKHSRPSFVTYGSAKAALSVGLFGPAVLESADPTLHAALDAAFRGAAGGALPKDGGASGGCGGGCGGGGCGGGCGGGGGGCGGGGGGG